MKHIYSKLVRRRALFIEKAKTTLEAIAVREYIVASVGLATFFAGFGAGALLNLYFLAINHPLVTQFRATLSYKSAIFGDGILLPIVNMVVTSFLLRNWEYVRRKTWQLALISGTLVTIWFHVNQAVQGIVNWAMPAPWHWNFLGLWHGVYMFFVASLISLFYLTLVKVLKKERTIPYEALIVTLGIILFFLLLRLDYIGIDLSSLMPEHDLRF